MKKEKDKRRLINVIDLEACCWRGNPPSGQSKEIIEIGIACVDFYTKEIVEKRSILIKPQYSKISKFCTELTTITQKMINKEGISFKKACVILRKQFNSEKRMFVSWDEFDRTAFQIECRRKKVNYPFSKNHVNLKELFSFKFGLEQPSSVTNALKRLNIDFEGQKHRGVDDAFNTAKILQKICM